MAVLISAIHFSFSARELARKSQDLKFTRGTRWPKCCMMRKACYDMPHLSPERNCTVKSVAEFFSTTSICVKTQGDIMNLGTSQACSRHYRRKGNCRRFATAVVIFPITQISCIGLPSSVMDTTDTIVTHDCLFEGLIAGTASPMS